MYTYIITSKILVCLIFLIIFNSCEKRDSVLSVENTNDDIVPIKEVISIAEVLEGTAISDINFHDKDVIEILSFVEGKCNEQFAMMGELPIKIVFFKKIDLNMTLQAPVMRANMVLDVVALYSRIGYEIDSKERKVIYIVRE